MSKYRADFIYIDGHDFGYAILKENDFKIIGLENDLGEDLIFDIVVKVVEFDTIEELLNYMHKNEFSFDYDARKSQGVIVYENGKEIFRT